MRKQNQEHENTVVEQAFKEFEDSLPVWSFIGNIEFHKFRECNAKVGYFKGYTILLSYSTIVAFIKDGKLYDVLRYNYGYTATSAQHIAKFARDYEVKERYTWREI